LYLSSDEAICVEIESRVKNIQKLVKVLKVTTKEPKQVCDSNDSTKQIKKRGREMVQPARNNHHQDVKKIDGDEEEMTSKKIVCTRLTGLQGGRPNGCAEGKLFVIHSHLSTDPFE